MSPNGQEQSLNPSMAALSSLPRPLYGRVESLANLALTYRHSHPWAQLSYASQGVLEVQTAAGRFIAPPQRAVWVPAGMPHRVYRSPHTGTTMCGRRPAEQSVEFTAADGGVEEFADGQRLQPLRGRLVAQGDDGNDAAGTPGIWQRGEFLGSVVTQIQEKQ